MAEQTASKVPQIRFKGFADEWNTLTLGVLGKVATNKRVFIHQTTSTGDVPFYKIGTFGREPKLFISQSLFDTYKERFPYPEKGDLLISVIGSIGRIVEYTGKDEYFQDSNIVWLQHNGAVVNAFLKQFYSFVKWSGLEGSTIKHLYNKNILETQIDLPCQKEQTQIGKYFRELDSLIEQHQRKHDKLVTLKKAMLQKMFPQPGAATPEIRFKGFSGDWVEKKLGDIGLFYRGISYNHKNVSQSGLLVLRSTNIQNARLIFDSDLQFINVKCPEDITLRKGDIAICMSNGSKSLVGKSALCEIEPASPTTVGAFCSIFRSANPVAPHLFQTATYLKYLNELLAGSSINNLKNSDLGELIFGIPVDSAEQQKVGTYFRSLDELISKHATQLQKLQQIKSACLARMFV